MRVANAVILGAVFCKNGFFMFGFICSDTCA